MNTEQKRSERSCRALAVICGGPLVFILLFALRVRADKHEFVFDAEKSDPRPAQVNLAGSFNGWSKDATPMRDDGSGRFRVTLDLSEGVHYYKFVLDGDKWVNDPKSDKALEVDDGHGGRNSAVLVGPDIRKAQPVRANDIRTEFLAHKPEDVDNPGDGRLRLRVRAQSGDVKEVTAVVDSVGYPLAHISSERGFDYFGGLIQTRDKQPPRAYYFLFRDGAATALLNSAGAFAGRAADEAEKGNGDFVVPRARVKTPDWAKHAIWYQVFPERFRNGDESNDPGDKEFERKIRWQANWWETQPGEAPGEENFYKGEGNVWKRRYGGDIQGLIESLPYLKSLGINAIYLNPVFEADSMHKYDATDYRHIDDNFGTKGDIEIAWQTETEDPATWTWTPSDKLFLEFIAKAHEMGFKVIIDGVFNHVGRSHYAFQDVLKHGKSSKYADWFDIRDWNPPITYIAWDRGSEPTSDGHLPVFKKNPQTGLGEGPKQHIFAITKRWLAPEGDPGKGVDGWRLDVPGDIPHPFWIEWRNLVKETKPDAYISGEIWDWAQPWLNNGDQFDAVMNYRFAVACQDFFINKQRAIRVTEFNSRLNQMVFAYPLEVVLVQQNLFDSHDTDRMASMFLNPDLQYDGSNRLQDNGPRYNRDKPGPTERQRQKQMVAMQFTFMGAPMTYYGNENGMWSPDDPSNRQPMVWKDLMPYDDPQIEFNEDLFAFNQRLAAIRSRFAALRVGFYRPVLMDDARGVFAFVREHDDEAVYIVLNRNPREQSIDLPVNTQGEYFDWLDPQHVDLLATELQAPTVSPSSSAKPYTTGNGMIRLKLAPYQSAILTAD